MKIGSDLLIALTFSLCLSACNVFDGIYEEGSSSEPAVLLADARHAIRDGRLDDAVEYLNKAHERQPGNIEIRVELASALLTLNAIDVMLIAELADEIEGDEIGGEREWISKAGCPDDLVCNFDCGSAKSATPFSYGDSDAYRRLEEALHVLEQVSALVGVTLDELGAVPGSRFLTRADRKELYDALVDRIAEEHPREKARRLATTLLLDAGIASLSTTLASIEQSASANEITLYHVEQADGGKIVDYCGPDVAQFITGTMCSATSSAHFTLDMLKTRLENFASNRSSESGSIATELIDAGHELFDGLTSGVQSSCS
jgi:hypothetical protein